MIGVVEQVFDKEYIIKAVGTNNIVDSIRLIQSIIACKSQEVANHCIRVSILSSEIGKAYKLSERDMQDLFIASSMHDTGKIFIPNEILNKPSKLTKEEYEIIKTHSKNGYETLEKIEQFKDIAKFVLYHHERYDGKGYPHGVFGKEIPFISRIITIADAFDAMISLRPYKSPMSIDQAIKELKNNRNTQFDGDIVNVFIDLINKDEQFQAKYESIKY
ncbi:HD-GYP domain-containing protein [Oceanirhabdus seepicola]|uniref:HD-GYP domain-containing protein n=1 Tax=Oceanirhabdus seepicola TaxID=2828781 RepID=A0A9J6NYJ7_9CLOT|nr:HD-GYP domain-containing protein [Oceanirhabdus seepicola]MCM1989599.1 HD-GYP domain-containing protein [Oceanirhabdus seepicola]